VVLLPEFVDYFTIVLHLLRAYAEPTLFHIDLFPEQLRHFLLGKGKLFRGEVVMALLEQIFTDSAGFLHF